MKVLSLFDGMACGHIAFDLAGIKLDRYVAYEIDKYAIKTSSYNFHDIEHRGDVFKADFTEFRDLDFDFLIGGSPCTYWSIAQQASKRETTATGTGWELFSQYVRALNEVKPKYFIYENNKSMSKEIRDSINSAFGFDAVHINSALVSAQNRNRLYWVGKRNSDDTYNRVKVPLPKDNGIVLRDILNGGVHTEVSPTVEKRFTDIVNKLGYLPEHSNPYNSIEVTDKSPTLTTASGSSTSSATVISMYKVDDNTTSNNTPCKVCEIGGNRQGYRIYSVDGKSTAQTASSGGLGSTTGLYAIPISECKQAIDKIPIYEIKDGLVEIKGKQYPIKLDDGLYAIRKLSVQECMKLQTVPDSYVFPVSNAQAYKLLGNGWTCKVIKHLIECCMQENNSISQQLELGLIW
jgi:DNA (cytosine-5)-methyltransferase 3A